MVGDGGTGRREWKLSRSGQNVSCAREKKGPECPQHKEGRTARVQLRVFSCIALLGGRPPPLPRQPDLATGGVADPELTAYWQAAAGGKCATSNQSCQLGPRPALPIAARHLVTLASATQHEPLRNAFISPASWTCQAGQVQNLSNGTLHRLALRWAQCQSLLREQLGQSSAV
ncbi:uncharacterized protein LOC144230595 [Crocuta crocuta]